MIKRIIHIALLFLIIAGGFHACMKDDMRPVKAFDTNGNGVFIACEGNFMYGNSSLTYFDKSTGKTENKIFLNANGVPLGDVAQSIILKDNLLWISINNSGKIYIINPNNFEFEAKITGLTSPRYMLPVNNEIWISDLYSGQIQIVNSDNFEKYASIPLNKNNKLIHNAEQMIRYNNKVICNSWSNDNYLFFIDINKKTVVDSIKTGIQPKKLLLDKNNKIWVLCDGGYEGAPIGHEEASLLKIDPANKNIESRYNFKPGDKPSDICTNHSGDSIYLINKHIYSFHINSSEPGNIKINGNKNHFYSLEKDPETSDIYVSDAKDYMEKGTVYVYDAGYNLKDSINTGIIPSDFAFE